jgi:hypothetical protein
VLRRSGHLVVAKRRCTTLLSLETSNVTHACCVVDLSSGTNTVICAITWSMFCSLRGQLAMHLSCSIVRRGNLSHSPSAYQRYKCGVRLQPTLPGVGEGGPPVRFRTAPKSGWHHEWRRPARLGFVTARTVLAWPARGVAAELNTAYTPARLVRVEYPCHSLSLPCQLLLGRPRAPHSGGGGAEVARRCRAPAGPVRRKAAAGASGSQGPLYAAVSRRASGGVLSGRPRRRRPCRRPRRSRLRAPARRRRRPPCAASACGIACALGRSARPRRSSAGRRVRPASSSCAAPRRLSAQEGRRTTCETAAFIW